MCDGISVCESVYIGFGLMNLVCVNIICIKMTHLHSGIIMLFRRPLWNWCNTPKNDLTACPFVVLPFLPMAVNEAHSYQLWLWIIPNPSLDPCRRSMPLKLWPVKCEFSRLSWNMCRETCWPSVANIWICKPGSNSFPAVEIAGTAHYVRAEGYFQYVDIFNSETF